MEAQTPIMDSSIEQTIQRNISRWQDTEDPLAPLSEAYMDVFYRMEDIVKQLYFNGVQNDVTAEGNDGAIRTGNDFVKWMVNVEEKMKDESWEDFVKHSKSLHAQSEQCNNLLETTKQVINRLNDLNMRHQKVIAKTDSLHLLSEELMKYQAKLRIKSSDIEERLTYFNLYNNISKCLESVGSNVNNDEFIDALNQINSALKYFAIHSNFKESYSYKIKYENLLVSALINVSKITEQIIKDATSQVVNGEARSLLNVNPVSDTNVDSAFSFYYGKYQNASNKISKITKTIEEKMEINPMYKRTLEDIQKIYFAQRSGIMLPAVSTALNDLKEKHKNDHSILFRSSVLFVIKLCQDEAMCYNYFFALPSQGLDEYIATLCQMLYDILRPCLINVNHLEVLTELCTILKQMLNDQIQSSGVSMDQLIETITQLIHDVEERLVFRTNIFFQHDLLKYEPSPGDLAYPEKLQEIENIAEEIERRADSRTSSVSLDVTDAVNLGNYVGQFRSYTGNSPADLHGMWYPTVKRTLVCLSRLYICLDREIFQGLAQEALIICVRTVNAATEKISARKSVLDGKLFQIKHLLIIREQIAPFQVDFTARETSLDFSTVKTAAAGLIQKRDRLFTFSSNNAILEFLLEGTPKVKEYLVDSRKEIDKQLKTACESFITNATEILIGDVLRWTQKAEQILKLIDSEPGSSLALKEQEFARPKNVAETITYTLRQLKTKIPELQKSMRLYLANRETEFILFKPIKNNVLNCFMQMEQIFTSRKYTQDDQLLIACPSTEQLNVLICSVSLTTEQDRSVSRTSQARYSESR